MHINSIQALDDGYLVSARHLWDVIKVKKDGSIDWHMQVSIFTLSLTLTAGLHD